MAEVLKNTKQLKDLSKEFIASINKTRHEQASLRVKHNERLGNVLPVDQVGEGFNKLFSKSWF